MRADGDAELVGAGEGRGVVVRELEVGAGDVPAEDVAKVWMEGMGREGEVGCVVVVVGGGGAVAGGVCGIEVRGWRDGGEVERLVFWL